MAVKEEVAWGPIIREANVAAMGREGYVWMAPLDFIICVDSTVSNFPQELDYFLGRRVCLD